MAVATASIICCNNQVHTDESTTPHLLALMNVISSLYSDTMPLITVELLLKFNQCLCSVSRQHCILWIQLHSLSIVFNSQVISSLFELVVALYYIIRQYKLNS